VRDKADIVTEPQQLTLWPDGDLPGQLALFNRRAAVGVLPEKVSSYCQRYEADVVRHFPGDLCFHCETLLTDFLANRKTPPKRLPPSAPLQKPGERSAHHSSTEIIPAASAYL